MTEALSDFLKTLPSKPGVYQMIDAHNKIVYIGKAKKLDRRVKSYFQKKHTDLKTQQMVSQIDHIEIITARTEYEALVLENNLIKSLKPKYNIIFKDDKSYPFVLISKEPFPKIIIYRGSARKNLDLLGPFPDTKTLRESLICLQKIFKFRHCETSYFKNRTRPCLQYQIERCSAPCVNYISQKEYTQNIQAVKNILSGKPSDVILNLETQMQTYSDNLEFEKAQIIRDQIQSLHKLRAEQSVFSKHPNDLDCIATAHRGSVYIITVLKIRSGKVLNAQHFWPKMNNIFQTNQTNQTNQNLIQKFLENYYGVSIGSKDIPRTILVQKEYKNLIFPEALEAFSLKSMGFVPKLKTPYRGEKLEQLKLALLNAEQALDLEMAKTDRNIEQFNHLFNTLNIPESIRGPSKDYKIECFDISHTQGHQTVASCVVYNLKGIDKKNYRKFNISGITPGDDYAALYQAIYRRYTRLRSENKSFPNIVLIDGGKNQLSKGLEVWASEKLNANTLLIGISKGEGRKAGLETLWVGESKTPLILNPDDPALHLLQRVRDEAHRFAITGHRAQRSKNSLKLSIKNIPGVGPKRAKNLLNYFGGTQGIEQATAAQIAQVPGISLKLAEEIKSRF